MTLSKEEEYKKRIAELERLTQSMEAELKKRETGNESTRNTEEGTGEPEVPLYKCKGKDCTFSTDDISALMLHTVEEHSPKPAEPEKPRHRTIDEARGFLACPECRKSFVEAFKEDPKLPEEVGLVKPPPQQEKPPEKKEKKGFHF